MNDRFQKIIKEENDNAYSSVVATIGKEIFHKAITEDFSFTFEERSFEWKSPTFNLEVGCSDLKIYATCRGTEEDKITFSFTLEEVYEKIWFRIGITSIDEEIEYAIRSLIKKYIEFQLRKK